MRRKDTCYWVYVPLTRRFMGCACLFGLWAAPVYGVYVPLARRFMDAFDKVAYFWGMDFGKLTNVDRVDFALPPDHPANAGLLSKGSIPARQHLYIGPTGYNMKPWVGKWYAPGTKDKDHLRQYGKQFDTIEFNTTHYRIPDYATVLRWREEVPSDFRFCPKVPQTISHSDNLGIGTDEMRIFTQNILELGEKLGVCFLQLPPFFAPKDQGRLLRFLDLLPTPLPLSIEVRHEAFFRPDATAEAFFSLLTERGIHAIITDVAGRRDVCHSRLSTRKVLIRLSAHRGLGRTPARLVCRWLGRGVFLHPSARQLALPRTGGLLRDAVQKSNAHGEYAWPQALGWTAGDAVLR
jgi:uncharacterized protein YecE (DUF72 family)